MRLQAVTVLAPAAAVLAVLVGVTALAKADVAMSVAAVAPNPVLQTADHLVRVVAPMSAEAATEHARAVVRDIYTNKRCFPGGDEIGKI